MIGEFLLMAQLRSLPVVPEGRMNGREKGLNLCILVLACAVR